MAYTLGFVLQIVLLLAFCLWLVFGGFSMLRTFLFPSSKDQVAREFQRFKLTYVGTTLLAYFVDWLQVCLTSI